MNPKRLKRTGGRQRGEGKPFRLAKEVASIQRRAAEHDGCLVTIGQLVLFSTETGDAWMLDPVGELATAIARQGEALPVHIEDTNRNFMVAWMGNYRIDGELFLYRDKASGNTRTIFGYPTDRIAEQITRTFG